MTGFFAANRKEYLELIATDRTHRKVPIVTSIDDWKIYVARIESPTHPLYGVPFSVIQDFTDSLKFHNGGLAHSKYSILTNVLTHQKFEELWIAFGIAPSLFAQLRDYYCGATDSDPPFACLYDSGFTCNPDICKTR